MAVTPSALRADIYRLLDQVLETGTPLEVDRDGETLVIAPKHPRSRLERLVRRDDFVVGDPGELSEHDWSGEWRP